MPDHHGTRDVERVERWHSGGCTAARRFVLQLRDARRVYVDFLHWHGFEQDEDFRIEVEFLAPGQDLPSPRGPAPWPTAAWSLDTTHLDKLLAGERR